MLKIIKFFIIIGLILPNQSFSKDFAPWQKDVKVGDGLVSNTRKHPKTKKRRSHHIINSLQGGGFFMLRFFQYFISPQDGPNCRHVPVCSTYAIHAIKQHGALWGCFLTGDRLLRCNTFYPPEKRDVPRKLFEK